VGTMYFGKGTSSSPALPKTIYPTSSTNGECETCYTIPIYGR